MGFLIPWYRGVNEANRSNCGQTVRRHVDGYEEEEYPDRIFIGQCETTLVQGPETDKRDSNGGKSS
jgi:hypothetical protein